MKDGQERKEGIAEKSFVKPVKKTIALDYDTVFDEAQSEGMIGLLAHFQPHLAEEVLIPQPPLRCLSVQGGGAKGGGYPGCAEAIEESGHFDEIKFVGGASAGAITSFIWGLGFSPEQFKHLSRNVNFLDYTDLESQGWGAFFNGHKVGVGLDLFHYGAAFKGHGFHHFAASMLEQILGDPNATFADLHAMLKYDPTLKDMAFKATRYNAKTGEKIEQTFSFVETPNIRIADAVRASMAFPGAFAPWPVRDKQGNLFGIFADGGILNNNPIDIFNQQAYYDPKYRPKEKKDHRGVVHQINPTSVSLALTLLEDLDDEITPFTSRIRDKKQQKLTEKKNHKTQHKEVEKVSAEWRFNDILNAVLWTQIGVPIREEEAAKHALYNEQTVQIWPEDVTTLEFDASPAKLERLYNSAKLAMLLWLKKYRDPSTPYAYPEYFDDSLSKEEKLLKKRDPDTFYHQKFIEYFSEFNSEMKKVKIQGKNDDDALFKNVRLCYLTHKIIELKLKMEKNPSLKKKPDALLESAFKRACQQAKEKEALIQKKREQRWKLIRDDEFIHHLADKIVNCHKEKTVQSRDEVLRLMRGQLSNIIPLIRAKKGGNLLSLILQAGDPHLAKQAFDIINQALAQCYYQGRKEEIKFSLEQMLNEMTEPSVPIVLGMLESPEMVKVVMDYGADPLRVDKQTRRNLFQEMIVQQNYEGFKALVEYCVKKKIDVRNLQFGNQSLGHYLINKANHPFLEKLRQEPHIMKTIFSFKVKNASQNNLIQEAAKVSSSPNDLRWHMVVKQANRSNLNFFRIKKRAQENSDAQHSKWLLAKQALKAILDAPKPEVVIKNLKPDVCLNILNLSSPEIGAIKLFELAQDPNKADILIELCENAYASTRTSKQFKSLLQQKINGKTVLYYAAEYGNTKLISYLRKSKYDMDINHGGPLDEPCALLHAAKYGQSDAVSALMKSASWGFRLGYHPVSRRAVDDPEKRTALHYLAILGTPSAFCDVLFGARGKSSPTKVTTIKDKMGKTPLFYLIEHNRIDILKQILESAKGKNRGYIFSADYYFADIFGWQENDLSGYPELELAKRLNPEIYNFLCDNLSADKKKSANIISHVEMNVASQIKNENKQYLDQAEEIAKFELSLMGETIYDDWVLEPKENVKRLARAQKEPQSWQKKPGYFSKNRNKEAKQIIEIDTEQPTIDSTKKAEAGTHKRSIQTK